MTKKIKEDSIEKIMSDENLSAIKDFQAGSDFLFIQ